MPWARFLPFGEWWNEAIYLSKAGVPLTREDIVRAIRDQDGGGHFDATITNEAYAELRLFDAAKAMEEVQPGAFDSLEPPQRAIIMKGAVNAHRAAVRQIAWEFLHSLDNFVPMEEAA